jgi:hypothetical protein
MSAIVEDEIELAFEAAMRRTSLMQERRSSQSSTVRQFISAVSREEKEASTRRMSMTITLPTLNISLGTTLGQFETLKSQPPSLMAITLPTINI